MGREEKMEGTTKYVSPAICWLTYICAFATIAYLFKYPIYENDAYWNGLAAHIISTLVIYVFSYTFGNSSLYDPAWAFLPCGLALGWVLTSDGDELCER